MGNIRSWPPLFPACRVIRAREYLLSAACAPACTYIRNLLPPSQMHRPRFSRAAPRRTVLFFLFAAPIKFVLVSRVSPVTIYKRYKKAQKCALFLFPRLLAGVSTYAAHTLKKALSRWDKFLFCRQNAIKNASLSARTGNSLTIA